jgi:AhpD family alkylhydroperoxidase
MAVMNQKGALDDKRKQLISLGVAAQNPCEYCVYAYNKAARTAQVTDAEIKQEISAAPLVHAAENRIEQQHVRQAIHLEIDQRRRTGCTRARFS